MSRLGGSASARTCTTWRVASESPAAAAGSSPDSIVETMGLHSAKVWAAIAVSDMGRAVEFYEGTLGLRSSNGDEPDGGRTYPCQGDTSPHVFPSPNARASGATAAGFIVDDVEAAVDELISQGVTLEQYPEPFPTDAKGIARM